MNRLKFTARKSGADYSTSAFRLHVPRELVDWYCARTGDDPTVAYNKILTEVLTGGTNLEWSCGANDDYVFTYDADQTREEDAGEMIYKGAPASWSK